MKILIVEYRPRAHEAEKEMFAGHDVMVVGNFHEAMNRIRGPRPADFRWGDDMVSEMLMRGDKTENFDVVCADFMLPERNGEWGDKGEEYQLSEVLPLGFVVAIRAAMCGAKIAIVHCHGRLEDAIVQNVGAHYSRYSRPAGKLVLYRNVGREPATEEPPFIDILGCRVVFMKVPAYYLKDGEDDCYNCRGTGVCSSCRGTGKFCGGAIVVPTDCDCVKKVRGKCATCHGTGRVDTYRYLKDWGKALQDLLAKNEEGDKNDRSRKIG